MLYVRVSDAVADPVLYHLYANHHLMIHVGQSPHNPAALWNYMDEDEIGVCAKISGVSNVAWLHHGAIERYRIGFRAKL